MRKKRITLCVLLAVFAVVSITAVLVSRHEEKVEQIKNSGETILAIPTDTVTELSRSQKTKHGRMTRIARSQSAKKR